MADENEFDFSKALSERDKTITELSQKLEQSEKARTDFETRHGELESRFKGVESFYKEQQQDRTNRNEADKYKLTDDDIKDGVLTESGVRKVAQQQGQSTLDETKKLIAESGETVSPQMQKLIEGLSGKIDNLQQQTMNTSLGLSDRYQDEDFKTWANDTKYSPFDPNSKTLAEHFDELTEKGDMQAMQVILDQYDKQARGGTSSPMPNTQSKQLTPEQKKVGDKIKETETKVKAALRDGDFALGRKLNSELDDLYKQLRKR